MARRWRALGTQYNDAVAGLLSLALLACACACACAGCGRVGFAERADGDADTAGSGCDLAQPFGPPVAIASLDPDRGLEGTLRLLPDELEGYYWSDRGNVGNETRLFRVTRATLGAPFTAVGLPALDSTSGGVSEFDPTPSSEDQVIVFRRTGTGIGDALFVATAAGASYTGVRELTELHTGAGEIQPFLQVGGDELYFSSRRTGQGDIYRATRTGTTFAGLTQVAAVSDATAEDGDPVISADGLALYFRSDRPADNAGFNIWMASRAAPGDVFGAPVQVPAVSSAGAEGPSWLSVDGCRLYLSSDRSGTNEPYVASRPAAGT